jgi:hypothetical protein
MIAMGVRPVERPWKIGSMTWPVTPSSATKRPIVHKAIDQPAPGRLLWRRATALRLPPFLAA